MSAIVQERTIAATPESVFNALTQQDEIVRWWANEGNLATDGLQIPAVTLTDRNHLLSTSPFWKILAGSGFFR